MNRFFALPLMLLLASAAFAQDESKEPPQSFLLKVGDKSLTIVEGETKQLLGSFANPAVNITPEPYRVFPYQGVRFQYPRYYAFEADLAEPAKKTWTLSGNDAKVMIFAFPFKHTPKEFAESVIDHLDRSKSKILDANAKLRLGDHTLAGTKFRVILGSQPITQEVYSLPAPAGTTRFFILQDSPDDKGNYSTEAKTLLALLQKSFQVDAK